MIITRTPFRVSFFGGGTDYPQWYREQGGAVLSMAIDKYCYISCRYLPPFFEHHSRIIYSRVENAACNQDIAHPAVRACLGYLGIDAGVEIHHDADLPARAGLGSSSAFVVGLLHALHALLRHGCETGALAQEAIHIEQAVLGEHVGTQDQIAAAFGGFNFLRFHASGSFEVCPATIPEPRLRALLSRLHLYFTGFSRTASEIAKHQIANTPAKAAELQEMMAMAAEGLALLAGPEDGLDAFGKLLHDAWRLKRSLSDRISSTEIDSIYEQGRRAGALGGKLLGAGGGGFMLFYVPEAAQAGFLKGMRPLLRVPFSLAAGGSQLVLEESEPGYGEDLTRARLSAFSQSA